MMATSNATYISFTDGSRILLSYGIPVAFHVPGKGFYKRARYSHFSVTTSRHINAFIPRGASFHEVDDVMFAKMIAPVTLTGAY